MPHPPQPILTSIRILSMVVQYIYTMCPGSTRHAESTLEGMLDEWYLDLPDHLHFDLGLASSSPSSKQLMHLPNVLMLHMQYWCVVLLLHGPSSANLGYAIPRLGALHSRIVQ